MKRIAMILAVTIALSGSAFAASFKPCEELKGEIDARIKAKGAVNYTLEIIPTDAVKDQEIVGSCDGGTKKIIYIRTQQTTVTSTIKYELASKACVDTVSDIKFMLSNHDQVNGVITARAALEGNEAYSKLNVRLTKIDTGVSITVSYDPSTGTTIRGGIVEAYLKALKVRIPDITVSRTN